MSQLFKAARFLHIHAKMVHGDLGLKNIMLVKPDFIHLTLQYQQFLEELSKGILTERQKKHIKVFMKNSIWIFMESYSYHYKFTIMLFMRAF